MKDDQIDILHSSAILRGYTKQVHDNEVNKRPLLFLADTDAFVSGALAILDNEFVGEYPGQTRYIALAKSRLSWHELFEEFSLEASSKFYDESDDESLSSIAKTHPTFTSNAKKKHKTSTVKSEDNTAKDPLKENATTNEMIVKRKVLATEDPDTRKRHKG